MTSALLKAGSSPNLRDKFGDTLLMGAVLIGALSNAKVLLAAGADVNAKAINGETALSIAKRNHLHHLQPMIELLTNAGAHE
jgi:ankyrin repeat protein